MPILLSLLILSSLTIGLHHDVHAASATNNDDELLLLSNIKCSSGWTGSASSEATVVENNNAILPSYIPKSWINDGYCDCPFGNENGMTDEPNTNACSGSKSWPGVMGGSISRYVIRSYVLRYVLR